MSAHMSQSLKQKFFSSLGMISLIIAVTESLVMLALEGVHQAGVMLTPWQQTTLNISLLTLLGAPLLWFLSLRPLALRTLREQARAERETQVNSELRQALDAHALVSIADVQGHILHANDKFCAIAGYTLPELLGQDHRIVNSGHHDKDYMREMWRTIARGQIWQGEFCNRSKQGSLYWVDSTIVPLLDEAGKPRQYISIRRDITALKESSEQLTRFKQAMDASSEMILITDHQGRICYANPELCRFSGWTETALLGRTPELLDSPNADAATHAAMQQALRHGETWSGRLLNRRRGTPPIRIAGQTTPPDPLEYWAETNITPIRAEHGTILGYVQIQHDVSEQVRRETALLIERQDTGARLQIAEVIQREEPLQDRCNRVLELLFGLETFHLQRKGGIFLRAGGEACLDMFVLQGSFSDEFIRREKRVDLGACLCGRAAVSGELLVSDDCFCDPRHEHRFEHMQAHGHYIVPLASAGAILGVLFLYTDPYPVRSESRLSMLSQVGEMLALAILKEQAKASLEAARDTAIAAAHAKSAFLANMSHEIRTPMNGVLGMLELLKDTDMSREQWDLVETASNSAETLLDILNEILDYSKLEAGKIEIEQTEFNLPSVVEEVCALLAGRAHDKGLELNCFLPADLPRTWKGDSTRIRQVLTNLIGNAVKFTDRGEVSIKLMLAGGKPSGSTVRFEVRDTGIGIAPEVQAHLFQPFSQADSSTARRFGGTGLGLSISKDLVDLMGGAIGVESNLGQGACFWFTLPLQKLESGTPATAPDFSDRRVLVVDDNATNRSILKHYLTHWGFAVNETEQGASALRELESANRRGVPYDLVLLDLHMPEMDGFAVSRAMSANPHLNSIPRLLLSSGGLASESECQALGITRSLLKPVRQSQLFDAIAESFAVEKRKTGRTSANPEVCLPDYSDKRVLVAEDNKVNQKVISAMLAKFHITPQFAANGRAALDLLEQSDFDLVLMDCQMPVLDGYEATRILRAQEISSKATRTAVVALTAHVAAGEREKCLTAGMDDYLSKPVTRERLAEVLSTWLAGPAAGKTEAPAPAQPPLNAPDSGDSRAASHSWDRTAALAAVGDDEELLDEMIDLFIAEAPEHLDALRDALEQQDLPALADAAHAIKGMAGHFCAATVKDLAARLEDRARTGDGSFDYSRSMEDLANAAERLSDDLRQSRGAEINDQ